MTFSGVDIDALEAEFWKDAKQQVKETSGQGLPLAFLFAR